MGTLLNDARIWMTRYVMSSYFVLGVIGNVINMFMFTRKNPLHNSCTLYLLAISIAHILTASWGVIPTLYTLDNVDPATYSYMYCKLRLYTQHVFVMIGRTLLVVACIDRYALCSNYQRFRAMNNPKVAFRIIILITFAWLCINIYIPFVQIFTGKSCAMFGTTAFIWALYTVVVPGCLTPSLMAIFGVLAVRNRRRLQERLNGNRNENSKRDYTLMVMLLSEVFVYVVSTSLFPITTLYKAVTYNMVKSVERQNIENFISFMGSSFLIYINPSATFFIYIAASQNYRHECKRTFMRLWLRLSGRGNQISTVAMMHTLVPPQKETLF